MNEDWKRIQRWAGVTADGVPGPATARAIIARAAIAPQPRAMLNPEAFFAGVRKVTGSLDQVQVNVINALLMSAAHWSIAWMADGLATAWHEARLRPVEEIGEGRGRAYGKPGARMKPIANAPTYGGQIPYGRGLVQLTWCENYERADEELGLNGTLLQNFDRALEPGIAVAVLVRGMEEGWFTGRKLADYLPGELGTLPQFREARRIINGTDRADLIAGYAMQFQDALRAGGWI